ncbi:hypothetical protein FHG87_016776 [Trinorchestia longiramus]|nr:hypothetical protein FHG87_016776 [Trinorchestia longiramus]
MFHATAVAVGLCLFGVTQSQGPQVGVCNPYQTTRAFDQAFISKVSFFLQLEENQEEYSFLLTSGPTFGCQKIKFLPNGTYNYNFVDLSNSRVNASGSYRMTPFSFDSPASITLFSLPFGELGSALGMVSFKVLRADEDLLVLISCQNYGLIRTQQLHVLIPESQSATIVAKEMHEIIQAAQVPLASYLKEVQQTCPAGARRSIWQLLSLYRWLVKFGIIPPIIGNPQEPSLYSGVAAPGSFVLAPQFVHQQAQIAVPGKGSVSLPAAQSSVFPHPAPAVGFLNEVPYFFDQQISPKIYPQIGLQQFQNPVQIYSGVPATHDTFAVPQFPYVVSNSLAIDGFPSHPGRPLSVPKPSQPIQGGRACGTTPLCPIRVYSGRHGRIKARELELEPHSDLRLRSGSFWEQNARSFEGKKSW